MIRFTVVREDKDTRARLGSIQAPSCQVPTPTFMPVATQASVKTLSPRDLRALGVHAIICNTYHLMQRPGTAVVHALGGLHGFMQWHGMIVTDSGGFQGYSLGDVRKVSDDGLEFASPLDGARIALTPESAAEVQYQLGTDIGMCLDFFTGYPASRLEARLAVERTVAWALRSRTVRPRSVLFAIVQGGTYPDLRRECAERLVDAGFPGYGLGGLMIGEPSDLTMAMVTAAAEVIPRKAVRYLMGAGYPEDIVEAVRCGVDLFDCVLPTRNGRTGMAFTSLGKVIIKGGRHAEDPAPLDPACRCYTCRTFSRGYLRHLFNVGEALGPTLISYHNIAYYMRLMKQIRTHLQNGTFAAFAERTRKICRFRSHQVPLDK